MKEKENNKIKEQKDKAARELGWSSHAERENHKLEIKQSINLNPPRTEKEEIRKIMDLNGVTKEKAKKIYERQKRDRDYAIKRMEDIWARAQRENEAIWNQSSGCMVALLIIIAPTILLSLLIF